MARRCTLVTFAFAASLASAPATAQEALAIPASLRVAPVPDAPGTGAQAMFVRAVYGGFPYDLRDAQALLEGTSFNPSFQAWCGLVPYVDFTNGTVRDSLLREAPEVLCFPFLDPRRSMPAATCRELPGAPLGDYYQGGGATLRIQGRIAIREAGTVTFAWGHDDGVGMYLAGTTVFEYRDPTGSRVDRRAVRFPVAGLYPFRIDWYDTFGGALLDWYLAAGDHTTGTFDGARFRLVPSTDLYPSDELPCTAACAACPAHSPRCDYARGRCVECFVDEDCAPCERCAGDACLAVTRLLDAAVPAACRPDGGTVRPDAVEADPTPRTDAGSLDAAHAPPERSGTCACALPRRAPAAASVPAALLAALLALTRRRRPLRALARGVRSAHRAEPKPWSPTARRASAGRASGPPVR